jgi:hypothetical protein
MKQRPYIGLHCDDCGIGTSSLGEYYMVANAVWEEAWAGRRKWWHRLPNREILCIGCLETRIGRKLTRHDFTNAPINHPALSMSDRLLARLVAT